MTLLWELIQPFIGYIGLGLTALLALWGKGKLDQRKGRKAERAEAKQKDAENAQDIRDRVVTGRPDRLHSVKDRGYRD